MNAEEAANKTQEVIDQIIAKEKSLQDETAREIDRVTEALMDLCLKHIQVAIQQGVYQTLVTITYRNTPAIVGAIQERVHSRLFNLGYQVRSLAMGLHIDWDPRHATTKKAR